MKTKITWKMFRENYLHDFAVETIAAAFGVHRNTLTNWEKNERVPDNEYVSIILRMVNLIHDGFVTTYTSGLPNLGPALLLNDFIEMFAFIEEARKMKSDDEVAGKHYDFVIQVMKLARGELNQDIGFKFPLTDEVHEKDLVKMTRPARPNEYVMF